MQNTTKKSIWWRSRQKTSLSRKYKHGFKKKAKLAFLRDFGQKVEVFSSFVFIKNRSRKRVFADVLDKKKSL